MQASGPAISPFKESPELRVAFIDALEENACEMIGAEDAAGAIIDATNNVPEAFGSWHPAVSPGPAPGMPVSQPEARSMSRRHLATRSARSVALCLPQPGAPQPLGHPAVAAPP